MKKELRIEEVDNRNTLIIILLTVQVLLVGIVLLRIINLERLLSPPTPDPEYYEDVTLGSIPGLGSKDAPIQIVAFSDFDCSHCASADRFIRGLMLEYPEQIYYVHRDFPLHGITSDSALAALAARCAGEQGKYWEMQDALFFEQGISTEVFHQLANDIGIDEKKFAECYVVRKFEADIKRDIDEGLNLSIDATPTIFINGLKVSGFDEGVISNLIKQIL